MIEHVRGFQRSGGLGGRQSGMKSRCGGSPGASTGGNKKEGRKGLPPPSSKAPTRARANHGSPSSGAVLNPGVALDEVRDRELGTPRVGVRTNRSPWPRTIDGCNT